MFTPTRATAQSRIHNRQAAAAFLALCEARGIDPASIPDAPRRRRYKIRPRLELDERRRRRRMLGSDGCLPSDIRQHFTEGERAVLRVVAGQVHARGLCDLTVKEIGDRAGASKTTVHNALAHAEKLGHIEVERRRDKAGGHRANIVRIRSPGWRAWLHLHSKRPRGGAISEKLNASKNLELRRTELPVDRPAGDNQEENSIGESPARKNEKSGPNTGQPGKTAWLSQSRRTGPRR